METKRVSTRKSSAGTWFDAMLGDGSAKTVTGAVGNFRRPAVAQRKTLVPRDTLRMRAVGSEGAEPETIKPKGYFRFGLLGLGVLVVCGRFKVLSSLESLKLPAFVTIQAPAADASASAQVTADPTPGLTPEPTPVVQANLSFENAGGNPVALWRSNSGQWYGVNSKAELSKMLESEASAKLNLPEIAGVPALAEGTSNSQVFRLQLDPEQLSELLPLREDLAGDVDMVIVKGRDFSLRTNGAGIADLGEDNFKRKQARLAAVLADLGARNKRASSVDLGFENTAVVRLAAR
jgi:hypothetical protein